jgi:hypothetical protein
MSKSFRELVEAINKKAEDDLAIGSKNRAKGHRKFVAAHTVNVNNLEDNGVTNKVAVANSAKADNTVAGERKPVKQGTSKLKEDVSDLLVKIAKSGKASMVTFADGDTAQVNSKSAKKLLDTQSKLNDANAKKFKDTLNKSAAGFLKMMNFSGPSKGDK